MRVFKNLAFACLLLVSCSSQRLIHDDSSSRNHPYNIPLSQSVALVEWQFPLEGGALDAHEAQLNEMSFPNYAELKPSLFPNLSELNTEEEAEGGLGKHSIQAYDLYKLGRDSFAKPFLLNFSATTPKAVQTLITMGIRVFSFSSVIRDFEWSEFKSVIQQNPDVLFFVAAAHISGTNTSLESLNEFPTSLAFEAGSNVIPVGCIDYYQYNLDAHRDGTTLGSRNNPYEIFNQPARDRLRYYMINCKSARAISSGFGGTSAATPALASLAGAIIGMLERNDMPTNAETILTELDTLMHTAKGREKSGDIENINFFSLDTVLINLDVPLITESIWWGDFEEYPSPISWSR